MRKKKKQKKSLHPPGGELLSAMQVPSDLAFGEPVVTFYGGREVQIENYRRILEYNACRLCVLTPVSYTHLDVYKRQSIMRQCIPDQRNCKDGRNCVERNQCDAGTDDIPGSAGEPGSADCNRRGAFERAD